jgi:AraC-like DNA-binding protein
MTAQPGAPAGLADLPFSLLAAAPPYNDLRPVPDLAAYGAEQMRPGLVWVIEVAAAGCTGEDLAAWIPRLRAAYPAVPVALWLDEPAAPISIQMAAAAGALRVRALLMPDNPLEHELRRQLSTPHDLAADLIEWLQLLPLRLPHRVTDIIHGLIREGASYPTLTAFLDDRELSGRTVRARFAACGIPGPGSWFALARLLPALLRIQREPKIPLLTIAIQAGYSDHAALSHKIRRLFGVRAGEVRETIGWEWLLLRFLER